MQGGTVSGRVALLLRSAEVKPFLVKICSTFVGWTFLVSFFLYHANVQGRFSLNPHSQWHVRNDFDFKGLA